LPLGISSEAEFVVAGRLHRNRTPPGGVRPQAQRPVVSRPDASASGPAGRLTGRALAAAALALAVGSASLLPACSSPSPPPEPWLARVAGGQLDRARAKARAGEQDSARRLAADALVAARQSAHLPTMAQAQLMLGRLEGNADRLREAQHIFEMVDDPAGQAEALVSLAELAVRSSQIDAALAAVQEADRLLEDVDGSREERARTSAQLDHLHATVLRLSGRRDEAAGKERRAQLQLTLLRDDELVPLRISVSQSLGDDCAAELEYRQAVEHHARASDLARRSGDHAADLSATESLVTDLQALGRPTDAIAHGIRALHLALELQDRERASENLRRAQQLLMSLGEGPGSPRWDSLIAAVQGA
jgi:tetratricopeptide (TPR) repeat protein